MRNTASSHRLVRLLAVPLAAALVLAGCGGGDDDIADESTPGTGTVTESAPGGDDSTAPPPASGPVIVTLPPETAPPEPEAVQGGTLRIALEAEVDGLNPTANQVTAASGLNMAAAVFDTLAATDTAGNAVPYLAESFTPNDDYTTWDVKLREGITFHDGTPLDAAAVQRNFEAQLAHPLVGLAVVKFHPASGATEIVDPLTIRYHLLDPNAEFPARLATQIGMVASPQWLDAAAADPSLNQQPVGTGPFKFDSRSEDSVTRFVRNDDYWNGTVYLDAVEYRPVPDQAAAADLLYAGDVDGLPTADAGVVADLRTDDSLQHILDDTGDERFIMLNTSQPPFDDIRARQALALATPRQLVLDLIAQGQWRPADSRFPPESPYSNPAVVQQADDPDAAVALVAEYCAERGSEQNPITQTPTCTDGKINMAYQWSGPSTFMTRQADALTQGWSATFNVTLDEQLQDSNITLTATGQYNAVSWTQFNDPAPTNDSMWLLCSTIGGISINFPRYCDEARDDLLMQAQATDDPAQQAALIQQAEALINESYTYIFIGHLLWDYAFATDVHGVCERTSPEGVRLMCVRQGNFWPTTIWMG